MSSSSAPRELYFENRPAVAAELARSIADDLDAAVGERGEAGLVVSGGSTPRQLFDDLSRIALPWEKVRVTLSGERWVPLADEDSNERLVRRHLLVGEAAAARLVPLKNDAPTPEEGRDACDAALAALPRPFDVVVLGMGDDGHTASLYPAAPELGDGLDRESRRSCVAVRPPGASHPRMSMTLAALLDSRRIVIYIIGDEKWGVYQKALAPGPAAEYPIRAVLESGHPRLEVYWAP